MRPVGSVQLPIAEFALRVRDFDGRDAELAAWLRSFSMALAYADPTRNDFAAKLLTDVDEYRAARTSAMRDRRGPKKDQDGEDIPAQVTAGNGEVFDSKRKEPLPKEIGDVYAFGARVGICESTCHQFWEINTKNEWRFKGKIHNWKGALIIFARKDKP